MINILIHSTLITDRESSGNSERSEETRKHYNYHALVKKLKKEFGEKNSPSLKYLRQLLPIPKMMTEVIVTEPFGLINEKGSKVKGLNCDKKPGIISIFKIHIFQKITFVKIHIFQKFCFLKQECKWLKNRKSVLGMSWRVTKHPHPFPGPGSALSNTNANQWNTKKVSKNSKEQQLS